MGVFRPVWQEEIEREVRRNGVRLAVERGNVPLSDAEAGMDHALVQMTTDVFLLDRLAHDPELVISAVRAMARRHRRPAHTVEQLAELMAEGELIPGFGKRLRELMLP